MNGRTWTAIGLAAAIAAGIAVSSVARAGDEPPAAPQGPPPVQKKVDQTFMNGLIGKWAVVATGGMAGKGTAVFAKGVGDTAVLETYEQTGDDGGTFYGHGIHKVSDDNKTVTVWWLDNFSSEPLKLTGPLTDTGYEISGPCPGMGVMKITFVKKGDALEFKMFFGDVESGQATYTKAM